MAKVRTVVVPISQNITTVANEIGDGWTRLFAHLNKQDDQEGIEIATTIIVAYNTVIQNWEQRLAKLVEGD
jgi:hypothetical protein